MENNYNNITSPEELLKFMSGNIEYGYLGRNNHIYKENDPNFDKDWLDEYILENASDVLKTKIGNCWDQVELERDWFKKNNYEFKTIYHQVLLDYDNPYPTHTFLVYKKDNKYYWFENAWENMRGIHEFNSIEELLEFEYKENIKMLKNYNILEEEIKKIKYCEYDEPVSHISAMEFVESKFKNKELIIKR